MPRSAGGSFASPHAENRNYRAVHVLFFALVATVLAFGVTCFAASGSIRIEGSIEFTGGIVAATSAKWLGNMAKAVHPIAVDVLLCTAGLVKRGIGGS